MEKTKESRFFLKLRKKKLGSRLRKKTEMGLSFCRCDRLWQEYSYDSGEDEVLVDQQDLERGENPPSGECMVFTPSEEGEFSSDFSDTESEDSMILCDARMNESQIFELINFESELPQDDVKEYIYSRM